MKKQRSVRNRVCTERFLLMSGEFYLVKFLTKIYTTRRAISCWCILRFRFRTFSLIFSQDYFFSSMLEHSTINAYEVCNNVIVMHWISKTLRVGKSKSSIIRLQKITASSFKDIWTELIATETFTISSKILTPILRTIKKS